MEKLLDGQEFIRVGLTLEQGFDLVMEAIEEALKRIPATTEENIDKTYVKLRRDKDKDFVVQLYTMPVEEE